MLSPRVTPTRLSGSSVSPRPPRCGWSSEAAVMWPSAASGTSGTSVTVWIPSNREAEGAFAVGLLKQLGYQAEAKHLGQDYYAKAGNSRLKVQAGVQSWGADYPAPWDFIFLLSCRTFVPNTGNNINFSEFCDPQIDHQIARARELEVTDPALASSLWSRIDSELVD